MNLTVKVLYFAMLREQAGKEQETVMTPAQNAEQLYQQLAQQYGFHLPQKHLRVAINHAFCDWQTPLNQDDVVAFIPPVAGG